MGCGIGAEHRDCGVDNEGLRLAGFCKKGTASGHASFVKIFGVN
jgi:hypothetical protein